MKYSKDSDIEWGTFEPRIIPIDGSVLAKIVADFRFKDLTAQRRVKGNKRVELKVDTMDATNQRLYWDLEDFVVSMFDDDCVFTKSAEYQTEQGQKEKSFAVPVKYTLVRLSNDPAFLPEGL